MALSFHVSGTIGCSSRRGGFTLLELLVVISILALALAIVPPMLTGATATAELKSAARELSSALRHARSRAIARSQDIALTLNIRSRRYQITGINREHALPTDLDFKVFGAASESPNDDTGGIRFFPDGSSTGGRISVARGARALVVEVDWLLGRVAINE
ncbi:MAG: GspH/FimT family pseudopilin [Gammaproteobacteria bacterium]|nr:GspH/FimT family pseudopilin [Gammaproteobacteria bacterium]